MKVYFYQSDIDEFMQHKDELCDAIRKGDISFAYTVFRTFLQRVDERVKTVDELLASRTISRRRADGDRPRHGPISPRCRPRPATAGGSGSSTTCWC